ncbi:hypothetical protein CERSUDRAFT_95154 [Gelatoporia subvermispora B]|uniref:F-box domain-containing protein n=1 Tax=Ceriporiopsis subvermispora (strain B) TaxID=914234 RepID=M2RDJ0_CERS8|nr:hypothetical protein CERSUDRAFT_95154 [Gelatoporia subvermispora B]
MVTADSLNLDCLELIFAYLHGNDLVSIALVSRSFLAGVIPRLYRTLVFKLHHGKRFPAIMSPFAAVVAHPGLSIHVRAIDIRMIPMYKGIASPVVMNDCLCAIALCKNLGSFTCTPHILPSFLNSLQDKKCLEEIRVNANLTTDQTEQLTRLRGLRRVILDAGSWTVVDALPRWTSALQTTLTDLTLYAMHDLHECILETVLSDLPNLTGLHVIGCSKVDHFSVMRLTSQVPNLESLSFTSWESPRPLPTSLPALSRLRHLTVDTHCTLTPSATPNLWTSIIFLTRQWSCPLRSITLKLSEKLVVADTFIRDILDAHEATLTHVALLNCGISVEGVRLICARCNDLERLAVGIPVKEMPLYTWAAALQESKTLQTLCDINDTHSTHGPRPFLARGDIRLLMNCVPTLDKIITDERVWRRTPRRHTFGDDVDDFGVSLEPRKPAPTSHWFMPR